METKMIIIILILSLFGINLMDKLLVLMHILNNLDKDLEAGDQLMLAKFQLKLLNSELNHYAILEISITVKLLDIVKLQLKSFQDSYIISLFISISLQLFINID